MTFVEASAKLLAERDAEIDRLKIEIAELQKKALKDGEVRARYEFTQQAPDGTPEYELIEVK